MPSFTTQVPNLQQSGPTLEIRLIVNSLLEENLRKDNAPIPPPETVQALIDTGATTTVINPEIASALGLNPIGTARVHTASHSNIECNEYFLRVLFPNNVIIETTAIAAPLRDQPIKCLLGRDILSIGVFIYTGYVNTFTLSF